MPHSHGHVLGDDLHGLYLTMAGLTGYPSINVRAVVEVDVVGKAVDSYPRQRAPGFVDRRQVPDSRAVGLGHTVAVHAGLDGRDACVPGP